MIDFGVKVDRLGESGYVLAPAGEIDMYTAPVFERELLGVIEDGGRDVVVDLSEASFIGSTFLGVLLGCRERLNGHSGRISIVCCDRNVARLFELTGLDRVFPIHPTLDGAAGWTSLSANGHR